MSEVMEVVVDLRASVMLVVLVVSISVSNVLPVYGLGIECGD